MKLPDIISIILTVAGCMILLYGGMIVTRNMEAFFSYVLQPEVRTRESYARARQDCQGKHGFAGAEYEKCMSKARKLAWR